MNDFDIDTLRQWTYDDAAETYRARRRTRAQSTFWVLIGVTAVLCVSVQVVFRTWVATVPTGFIGFLVAVFVSSAHARSAASAPIPCGKCGIAMQPLAMDYLNAEADIPRKPYDGFELSTLDDGRTYLYNPPHSGAGEKVSRDHTPTVFLMPETHAPSEPLNSRPSIGAGTHLILQEWLVCRGCQRAFVSRKFVFRKVSGGRAAGEIARTQTVRQRLAKKKARFKTG